MSQANNIKEQLLQLTQLTVVWFKRRVGKWGHVIGGLPTIDGTQGIVQPWMGRVKNIGGRSTSGCLNGVHVLYLWEKTGSCGLGNC